MTAEARLGDTGWTNGVAVADYNNDGWSDIYLTNFGPNVLYRNNGDGTFTNITASARVNDPGYYGFQPVAFDYDEDGDLDLFVANDVTPNFLWRNNGDGTFNDVALQSGLAVGGHGQEQACMGVALGDYNQDGRLDLYVTNFSEDYNTLYRNDGGGFFTDATAQCGLVQPTWLSLGWACAFFDYDNDGDADLYAANGHVYPQVDRFDFGIRYRQANQLFENAGHRFNEVTRLAGAGLLIEKVSRGAAFGDYDNDGDVDIVVNNLDDRPTLLRNEGGNASHWLSVRLIGTQSSRDPVGAVLTVTAGGKTQTWPVVSGTSFLSANDPRLHIGLGRATHVDHLQVRWPSGRRERFENIQADQRITIEEGRGLYQQNARQQAQ